jgi:hypothetical protein
MQQAKHGGAHLLNPATQEAEMERSQFEANPGKKLVRPISKTSWVGIEVHPSTGYCGYSEGGRRSQLR